MTTNAYPLPATKLLNWTQNVAICAICANMFSTALANIGFALFLILFACLWLPSQRQQLNTQDFPRGVVIALALYLGWQAVGLIYTDAPLAYALRSLYSERKICFVLPLVLIFSDEAPKKRFLLAFLATATVGLCASYVSYLLPTLRIAPGRAPAEWVRSHATQGMVFALAVFVSVWWARQQSVRWRVWTAYALAIAFLSNIAIITWGRSGYVVFLTLIVWSFVLWKGIKGLAWGLFAALFLGLVAFNTSMSVQDSVMKGVEQAQTYDVDAAETSLGRRVVLYQVSLELIREHPLLGVGTGGFEHSFSAIAEKKYTGWRAVPYDDPHNQYLFALTENGLIGLISFIFLLVTLFRQCCRGDIYGNMAAGCILAWSLTSIFSGHFRTFPEGHLIAFIVGILMIKRKQKVLV